ncbi:MAG: hypothetical protein ACWGNV_00955 [Bacteroidales bacterium]
MKKHVPGILGILIVTSFLSVQAQEDIPWLTGFTGEIVIGNDTYQYAFTTVEDKDCKVEFKELLTDKKGETASRSWIFYLSDLDPEALQFKARGKSIQVTMETAHSQKFISSYEGDVFDEYTQEMVLTMNEVDQARQLIDAVREHIGSCRESETTWADREEAIEWLTAHIGEATDDDVKWEQQFSTGEAPHLVTLSSKSTDDKGVEASSDYIFDLSDIDPNSVSLVVAGKSLHVEVPVKDKKRYIQLTSSEGDEYIQELNIYSDDIEEAREIVHALEFAAAQTEAVRPAWENYNSALEYIKAHLDEVHIGSDVYELDLEYDLFASDIINLRNMKTGSDGKNEETVYSFYPADMIETPELEVSRNEITVQMETKEDRDFIRKSSGGSVSGYVSDLEFHVAGIDEARNLIGAWTYIIQNSEEELETFEGVEEVNAWLGDNFPALYRDGVTFEQVLSVDPEMTNQITFEITETEESGEKSENSYILYPEDIDREAMRIHVRFGKLTVTLETGREDYIKHFENGVVQHFTNRADIYFFDPLVAKNFMEAIRFLISDAAQQGFPEMNREEVFAFLSEAMPVIELPEETHKQSLEVLDPENCKLKFTRVETEKGKESEELAFEFMASDLSDSDSDLLVKGNLIEINLETAGNRKLVKPFENGEVQDFTDGFTIYADDVRQARQILKAFEMLSKACE